jgi:hypothetical protein
VTQASDWEGSKLGIKQVANPSLLPLIFPKDDHTTGKHAFAVLAKYTAKPLRNTAKLLPCGGTRQSPHGEKQHGKGSLPCAFLRGTRQSLCRVPFIQEHGKNTVDGIST